MVRRRESRLKTMQHLHSAVYRRAKWQCQMPVCLCPGGRPIDRALRGKDSPWAPSIDHIIPRAAGGVDALENMRAAHRWCNQAKEKYRRNK
jgi:hypothetical protein